MTHIYWSTKRRQARSCVGYGHGRYIQNEPTSKDHQTFFGKSGKNVFYNDGCKKIEIIAFGGYIAAQRIRKTRNNKSDSDK